MPENIPNICIVMRYQITTSVRLWVTRRMFCKVKLLMTIWGSYSHSQIVFNFSKMWFRAFSIRCGLTFTLHRKLFCEMCRFDDVHRSLEGIELSQTQLNHSVHGNNANCHTLQSSIHRIGRDSEYKLPSAVIISLAINGLPSSLNLNFPFEITAHL